MKTDGDVRRSHLSELLHVLKEFVLGILEHWMK